MNASFDFNEVQANPLIFILGGVRSGKSRFAEETALAWQKALSSRYLHYIATAQAFDEDGFDQSMKARIAAHQARRGAIWDSHEIPLSLSKAVLKYSKPDHAILIDCMTLYLTNHLIDEGQDFHSEFTALKANLAQRKAPIIMVSNETNLGLHGDTKLGRDFQDQAGLMHQAIAALADNVILMVAGLPLYVKGNKDKLNEWI